MVWSETAVGALLNDRRTEYAPERLVQRHCKHIFPNSCNCLLLLRLLGDIVQEVRDGSSQGQVITR